MGDRNHAAKSGIAGGLILVAIGVLLLLNQNGILRFHDIWRLWPMLLVAAGIARLTQMGSSSRFLGVLLIVVGGILEAAEFHWIPYRVKDLWPIGIIGLGLLLLWQSLHGEIRASVSIKGTFPKPVADHLSIFGAGERRISTPDFDHADVLSIFAGYKLDLRKAGLKGPSAVIDATAIFGGIEIIVPDHWNVVVRGVGIFGGYGDESHHPSSPEPAPELVVQGVAVFGGVVIKN